jgi:hypothetical protein
LPPKFYSVSSGEYIPEREVISFEKPSIAVCGLRIFA